MNGGGLVCLHDFPHDFFATSSLRLDPSLTGISTIFSVSVRVR